MLYEVITHLIAVDPDVIVEMHPGLAASREAWERRAMLVRRTKPVQTCLRTSQSAKNSWIGIMFRKARRKVASSISVIQEGEDFLYNSSLRAPLHKSIPIGNISYSNILDTSHLIFGRITSYNVCYTKLLRIPVGWSLFFFKFLFHPNGYVFVLMDIFHLQIRSIWSSDFTS